MTSAQSEHLDTTIKLYRELREYSYDKVLSDLSPKFTYNPNDVKQLIQPMLTLYKLMNEAAIPLVPEPYLSNLNTQMDNDRNKLLKQLESTNPDRVNPVYFDQMKAKFAEHYPKTFEAVRPYFAPSIMLRVNLDHLNEVVKQGKDLTEFVVAKRRDTDQLLTELKGSADGLVNETKAIRDKATEFLGELKNSVAEAGIIEQAANFKKTIDDHRKHAILWLCSACIFAGILLCIACYFFEHIRLYYSNEVGKNIQLGATKLVILGIFSYGLFVSIKNYQAHTHNRAVNRHRYNAILTYNSFVSPATDDDVRDKILTYVASCVFSPQDTGFTGAGPEGVGAKNIIEIFGKTGGENK